MQKNTRSLVFAACLFLAGANALIYYPVAGYDFIHYDDIAYTTQNPILAHGLSWAGIRDAFVFPHAGGLWIPLTWISFLCDHALFGFNPGAFHLMNVLFHAANSILVFLLFFRMTGAWGRSLFLAALFAVHPLRVESVAWVTERKDVLSTLFGLAAMLFYVDYAKKGGATRYALVAGFFALSLMAKPMLVTLPLVLLLADYWPLSRLKANTARAVILEKLPLLGLSVAAGIGTILFEHYAGGLNSLAAMPLGPRLANALAAYAGYMVQMIWPAGLAVLYPYPLAGPPAWQTGAAFLLLAGVSVAVFWFARRAPYLAVGWLWYLVTLFPVSGVMQTGVQASADRFTYVPMLGLFVMIAWGAQSLAARIRHGGKALLWPGAVAVVAALAAVSCVQVRLWKNTATLFNHTISVTKNNWMAHGILGAALAEQGKLDLAMREFQETLKIEPLAFEGHFGMGALLADAGQAQEAILHYEKAIVVRPNAPRAHNNLGTLLAQTGRLEEAVAHFRKAAELDSSDWAVRENLGKALAMMGNTDEAALWLREALRIHPGSGAAHFHLGTLLARSGDLNGALKHLLEAVRLEPDNAKAHLNLGNVYRFAGKLGEAMEQYALAARLDPKNAGPHVNLGLVMASMGRAAEAKAQFEEALRLSPENQAAQKGLAALPKL